MKVKIRHLLYAALSLFALILIVELPFVFFGAERIVTLHTMSKKDFDRLPGYFEPNKTIQTRGSTCIVHTVTIDNMGFRGVRDIAPVKPAGTYRILCIGDSFVFGEGVNDDQTLPALLEKEMNKRSDSYGYEVINAGITGTTILDHIDMLKKALAVNPDMVVYVAYEDDLDNLVAIEKGAHPVFNGMVDNLKIKSLPGLFRLYKILENGSLYTIYHNLKEKLGAHKAINVNGDRLQVRKDPINYDKTITDNYRTYLFEFKSMLDAKKIGYVYCYYPYFYAREPVMWQMTSAARTVGMPVINLLEVFEKEGVNARELYLFPLNGHPSGKGYKLAARAIAEHIINTS